MKLAIHCSMFHAVGHEAICFIAMYMYLIIANPIWQDAVVRAKAAVAAPAADSLVSWASKYTARHQRQNAVAVKQTVKWQAWFIDSYPKNGIMDTQVWCLSKHSLFVHINLSNSLPWRRKCVKSNLVLQGRALRAIGERLNKLMTSHPRNQRRLQFQCTLRTL